jgi:Mu-like prophage I protein
MVALVTVRDRELIKTGTYQLSTGEFEATPELIQSAIKAHEAGVLRKPVVRLGHNDPRFSGDPAVGWIDNIRASEDGNTLYGDLVGVPEWLAEIMPSAYPSVSVEGLYDFAAPDGSHHDFILTGLALLGATPPGIDSLKSVQDVARLYDIAAEGRFGGTAIEFTVEAAQTQTEKLETQKEGGPAMALPENVAEALGIDANADEATIAAKLAEAGLRFAEKPAVVEVEVGDGKKEEAPAALPEPIAAASAPNVVPLQKEQYDVLMAAAAEVHKIRAEQASESRQKLVMAAINDGRITPASKNDWIKALEADPGSHNMATLASLRPGFVPVKETGHQGVAGMVGSEDGAPSPDKQAVDYAFSNVMARLGVSTKKGVNN